MESNRKRTVAYTLPPATIEAVKAEAVRQRRSASTVVGMVLEEWMEKQGKKEGVTC